MTGRSVDVELKLHFDRSQFEAAVKAAGASFDAQMRTIRDAAETAGERVGKSFSEIGTRAAAGVKNQADQVRAVYDNLSSAGARAAGEVGKAFDGARTPVAGLATEAQRTGSTIEQAFGQLDVRSGAQIKAEIDKVAQAYGHLANSGKASSADLIRAFDAAQRQIAELKAEAQRTSSGIEQSFSTLGIRSGTQIRADIARTAQAYGQLANSGRVSAEDLSRAYDAAQKKIADLRAEAQRTANGVEQAFRTLGIRSTAEIKQQIDQARAAYDTLAKSGKASADELSRAYVASTAQINRLKQELAGVDQSGAVRRLVADANTVGPAFGSAASSTSAFSARAASASGVVRQLTSEIGSMMAQVASVAGLVMLARNVAQVADEYQGIAARIRIATKDQAEFQAGLDGVFQVALRTSTAVQQTGELFTRVAQAGKAMNVSQQDALKLTETINQAIQLTGGSAASSQAAITQLIQALNSGVLRGEEFNSVMEQAPRLAQALADSLGLTIGQLRTMAQEGKISSEVIIRALQQQSKAIQAEFDKLPPTLGRAITNLRTSWIQFVGSLDEGGRISGSLAAVVDTLAKNLDAVASAAGRAGMVIAAALAVEAVVALRAFIAEASLATKAVELLNLRLSQVPRVVSIAIAIVGFELFYQIGTWLERNFVLARQLGVGIVAFFQTLVNSLQGLYEAAKALFTDDTVEQAYERWKTRQEQIAALTGQMLADAADVNLRLADSASTAATAVGGIGTAATGMAGAVGAAGASAAGSLSGAGSAAQTAAQAILGIAAAAKQAKDQGAPSIAALAATIVDAGAKSVAAAKSIGTGISEALKEMNGANLAQFRTTLIEALRLAQAEAAKLVIEIAKVGDAPGAEALRNRLDAVNQTIRQLKDGLVETGEQAAKSLGVDVEAASRRMSAAFIGSLDSLATLVRSLDTLRLAGIDTGKVLADAIGGMVEKAKNTAELDAVRARIEALGKAGELSKKQVKELQDALKLKLSEILPGYQTVAEAMEKLGLTSSTALKQQAQDAKEAYEAVRRLGGGADDVRKAFVEYAKAATAANNEVIPPLLRAQAEILGVADQLKGAATEAENLGDKIAGAAEQTRDLAAASREVATANKEAAEAEAEARRRYGPRESLNTRNEPVRAGEPQWLADARLTNLAAEMFGTGASSSSEARQAAILEQQRRDLAARIADATQHGRGIDQQVNLAIGELSRAAAEAQQVALTAMARAQRESASERADAIAASVRIAAPTVMAPSLSAGAGAGVASSSAAASKPVRVQFIAPRGNLVAEGAFSDLDAERIIEVLRAAGAAVTVGN